MSYIEENVRNVLDRIKKAALKVGRDREEILLVAISKGINSTKIREAIRAGIRIIGESRLNEAQLKYEELRGEGVEWHLVGHLQRNKVKKAIPLFDLIESCDRIELLREIDRRAKEFGKQQRILLQVNISEEASKGGFRPYEIMDLLEEILQFSNLSVEGLMGIGPLSKDESKIRSSFRMLKGIFDKIKAENIEGLRMRYLSLGMSDDFELAIEEGSNMVRIGRAIFGC